MKQEKPISSGLTSSYCTFLDFVELLNVLNMLMIFVHYKHGQKDIIASIRLMMPAFNLTWKWKITAHFQP